MNDKWAWRKAIVKYVSPMVLYCGFWQNYSVFSPNPRSINLHLEAIIKFENGTVGVWEYPRMERLPLVDRTFKERYRKFGHDYLNWSARKVLWPGFARWVARKFSTAENKPVEVILKRYWRDIPPPEVGLGHPAPEHVNSHEFFRYNVRPEDLQ